MPIGALLVIAATTLFQDCSISGLVVDAGTGTPVTRAQLAIEGREEIGAATDSEGRFVIAGEGCDKRKIQLIVTKNGFAAQHFSNDNPQSLLIKLQRESGLSGIVSDVDGQPLPDAVVDVSFVFAGSIISTSRQPAPVTRSGEYTLKLPPARYRICAHSDAVAYPIGGGRKLRYADRCINVTVAGGQQQHLDITLAALPAVHVSGTVRGVPEGAVPVVSIYPQGRETSSPVAVRSAPGGLFDFSDVVSDVYTIQASAVYGDKAFFGTEDVTVGSGGLSNLTVTALPGIDLTGSIRFQSASGQKPARLRLDLSPSSGSVEWNEDWTAFTISNVLQRKYRLGAMPLTADGSPGTADYYVQSIRIRDQEVLGKEFSVVGGAAALEIVLADDFGTLTGTVTDAEGKPSPSSVILSREGYGTRVAADKDGRIQPFKLPPGDYVVYAADISQIVAPEDAQKVTIPPSGVVSIAVGRTAQPQ